MRDAVIGLEVWVVVFLLLHDWAPLGRLTNRAGVRAVDSTGKLVWTTVLSAAPFALGLGWSLWYAPWPGWLVTYLRVSYVVLLAGALQSWWGPYFLARRRRRRRGSVSGLRAR